MGEHDIVFWHGWGMHPQVADGLAAHLPWPLHAPALPGYAGTAAASAATLDAWVDALWVPPPRPVTLVGWSLGALLALRAAQRYPAQVARLVLLGASPCFVQRTDWPHAMPAADLAAFRQAVAHDAPQALKRFVALFNQNDAQARAVSRQLGALLAQHPPPVTPVLLDGLDVLRDADLRPALADIPQPTLLIHGAGDVLMPLAAAQALAQALPQAQLQVVPDAGHAALLSDPAACAAAMLEFVRG